MKNFLALIESPTLATLACGVVIFSSSPAQACDPDPFIGTICYTAANFCPEKYSKAEGQVLAINEYQALYSLIGTYYGGNAVTTFQLPDLRGREAIGVGTGIGLSTFTYGQTSSMMDYTMTMQNMPTHVHTVNLSSGKFDDVKVKVSGDTADLIAPAGKSFGVSPKATYADTSDSLMDSDVLSMTATLANTQTGQTPPNGQAPISTLQPQIGLTACIAMDGVYPPRS